MVEISTCWRRNGESDSDGEEFLGFDVERESQRSNVESESDITVLSVNTEDLSDFSVTRSESGEEANEEWKSIPDPVVVNPLVANTGIVRDVRRFSVLDFFRLGKKISIKLPKKQIGMPAKPWKAILIVRGTKQTLKKSARTLPWTFSMASNNCQIFIRTCIWMIREKVTTWSCGPRQIFQSASSSRLGCKCYKKPTKNAAIDEPMIPCKGRLSMKQYMPLKPVKRGIKVCECADSSNGFVCDINVYTGIQRDGNPEQGLWYRVVHNLTRTLVGKTTMFTLFKQKH